MARGARRYFGLALFPPIQPGHLPEHGAPRPPTSAVSRAPERLSVARGCPLVCSSREWSRKVARRARAVRTPARGGVAGVSCGLGIPRLAELAPKPRGFPPIRCRGPREWATVHQRSARGFRTTSSFAQHTRVLVPRAATRGRDGRWRERRGGDLGWIRGPGGRRRGDG